MRRQPTARSTITPWAAPSSRGVDHVRELVFLRLIGELLVALWQISSLSRSRLTTSALVPLTFPAAVMRQQQRHLGIFHQHTGSAPPAPPGPAHIHPACLEDATSAITWSSDRSRHTPNSRLRSRSRARRYRASCWPARSAAVAQLLSLADHRDRLRHRRRLSGNSAPRCSRQPAPLPLRSSPQQLLSLLLSQQLPVPRPAGLAARTIPPAPSRIARSSA